MKAIILIILNIIFLFASCEENYFIKIGDKIFPFTLKDTKAANELKNKLPIKLQMAKLNDNEIYYQFNEKFTMDTKNVGTINAGDIYLYQSDYLVLFYKTFNTSYTYSQIGSLTDPNRLAEAIGSGSSALVEWCLNDCTINDTITVSIEKLDSNNNYYNFTNINFFIYCLIILLFL